MKTDPNYALELQSFREKAEARMRSPDSWLTVVGLFWLKNGSNSVGSAIENAVVLPKSVAANLGVVEFSQAKATIKFSNSDGVMIDGKPAEINKVYDLIDDRNSKPTQTRIGSVQFFLIHRKNGMGVRVKDEQAQARLNFKGRTWYSPNSKFVIEADWVAFDEPKTIQVPDILGNLNDEKSPGYARFKIEGVEQELQPILEDNKLFFIFRDRTSGKKTYGAARFLYADLPKNNKVILDFNKATNPPCAVTPYATCPMPPPSNVLKVAVTAGETYSQAATH